MNSLKNSKFDIEIFLYFPMPLFENFVTYVLWNQIKKKYINLNVYVYFYDVLFKCCIQK